MVGETGAKWPSVSATKIPGPGASGPIRSSSAVAGDAGGQSELDTLLVPVRRAGTQRRYANTARHAAIDGGLHKVRSNESKIDDPVDLSDAAAFAYRDRFSIDVASHKLCKPRTTHCNGSYKRGPRL